MKYVILMITAGLCSSCALGSGLSVGSAFSILSMEACSLTSSGQEELIKTAVERFELIQKSKE